MPDLESAYIRNGSLYLGFADGDVINAGSVTGPPGPSGAQLLSGMRPHHLLMGSLGTSGLTISSGTYLVPRANAAGHSRA